MKKNRWLIDNVRKIFGFSILEYHLVKYIVGWILTAFLATIISYYGIIVIYRIFK